MIRVFVCDDSAWFCELVKAWLEPYDDVAFAGYADEREGALERLAECRPDVVLLDTMTHGMEPLATADVRAAAPGARVLLCSGYPAEVAASMIGDADGYVSKDADELGMLRAVRDVARRA